jgi:hypothetical protein
MGGWDYRVKENLVVLFGLDYPSTTAAQAWSLKP